MAELVGAIHRDAVGEVARLALLGALEDGVDAGFDFPHEIGHDADGDEEDEREHDDHRRADARVGRIGLVVELVDLIRGEAFLLEDGLLNIQEGGTRDIFKAVRGIFLFARFVEVERFLRGVLIGFPVLLYRLQRGLGLFLALGFCEFVRSHPLIGEIEVFLEFGLRVIELLEELRLLGRVVGDEDHRRLEARGV